jgi:hypothetical protein
MTEPTLTPSRLWKRMTSDQRLVAARAFWRDEQATDDQIQAVMLISQQKKFRPKTVLSLDDERKAKHFAGLATLPDALAARTLVVYHLAEQRPMMAAFLDALGIAHENGLIQDDAVKPEPERVAAAVKTIAGQFPRESVTLYLDTLLCQDPETWGALADVSEQAEAPAAAVSAAETPRSRAPGEEGGAKSEG